MITKLFLITFLSFFPGLAPVSPADIALEKTKIKSEYPKKVSDSLGVKLEYSKAAVVLDVKTKRVLFEKNAYGKLPPASLTKIMTALLAFESKRKLDEEIRVFQKSVNTVERTIDLEEGEVVTLKDLLAGSLIASGNDAALTLALSVADGSLSKFVEKMNEKAKNLGLKLTHFENVNGLDAKEQVSSAYDLALLFLEAQKNPTFRELISLKKYEFQAKNSSKKHEFNNSNFLLRDDYPNVYGGKTGYTDEAGFCLAVLARDKEGNEIITIVLGVTETGWHFQETKALIDWTFKNYKWGG